LIYLITVLQVKSHFEPVLGVDKKESLNKIMYGGNSGSSSALSQTLSMIALHIGSLAERKVGTPIRSANWRMAEKGSG